MALSDTILGRRANKRAFLYRESFTVGVYQARTLGYSKIEKRMKHFTRKRYTDPVGTGRTKCLYRIRVIPKKGN